MLTSKRKLNILELSAHYPAIVIDENAQIIDVNSLWNKLMNPIDFERDFYQLFDKNSSLLVKNILIDVKTFMKVQRKDFKFNVDNELKNFKLIFSPFRINGQIWYFIVFVNTDEKDKLIIYPTINESTLKIKYSNIFEQFEVSFPETIVEKKNLQFSLDIEKEVIFIKSKEKVLFVNDSFLKMFEIKEDELNEYDLNKIIIANFYAKKLLVEKTVYDTKNLVVIESFSYLPEAINQKNRVVLFPITDAESKVIAIISIGSFESLHSPDEIGEEEKVIEDEIYTNNLEVKEEVDMKELEVAEIIYGPNNFEILDANQKASELYSYPIEELVKMSVTDLYAVEDMQKLLLMSDDFGEQTKVKHVKSDESTFEVNIIFEKTIWINKPAILCKIKPYLEESTYTEVEQKEISKDEIEPEPEININTESNVTNEFFIEKESTNETEVITTEEETKSKIEDKNLSTSEELTTKKIDKEEKSIFLSSLFHEILTPINVILGFVQEIIDSINKPTEEQIESAQIIKENQQLLLQSMNSAVQYAQLEEEKVKLNVENFDLINYLNDIRDTVSKISEQKNVEIVFDNFPESLKLKYDKTKLIAALSYYLNFAIRLTDSNKIFISSCADDKKLYFAIRDEENEISDNLKQKILSVYTSKELSYQNNFGISPITLRLARKLNEFLSLQILDNYTINNSKNICLVANLIGEPIKKIEEEQKFDIQPKTKIDHSEQDELKVDKEKVEIDTNEIIDIKDQMEVLDTKEISSETLDEITDFEIDETPLSSEEKEIIIEENILTDETKDLVPLSDLSTLVISDSSEFQSTFISLKKDFKFLEITTSLEETLPLLNNNNFDLIYLDINLSGDYNGFDLLKIIKQFPHLKNTKIIVLNGCPFPNAKERLINFGFFDYLEKPLLQENLLDSIKIMFS